MNETLLDQRLTLPEALMAFLHNEDGQVYQSVQPKRMVAAAELGELLLTGRVEARDDGATIVAAPDGATESGWVAEVLADLPADGVATDAWIRARTQGLDEQQEQATDQGVLTKDRAKLAGLIGYDRHIVDPGMREQILTELDSPEAVGVPRAKALAKLLTTPGMKRILGLDADQIERLSTLAESDEGTPLPGPMFSTMTYALSTVIGIGILQD